jgi:hypothetical protein
VGDFYAGADRVASSQKKRVVTSSAAAPT